jgi:ribosomal protein L27
MVTMQDRMPAMSSMRQAQRMCVAHHVLNFGACVQFYGGINVGTGKDFTLYAKETGVVVFETIKSKKSVRHRRLL